MNETDMYTDDYGLTPEEVQALAQATPQQIAEAATLLARDPKFWASIIKAFVEGCIRGLTTA
jgi:hypothetical protein